MSDDKELWWIEGEDGEKVSGPWETQNDAYRARIWVEKALAPETFWIRSNKEAKEKTT